MKKLIQLAIILLPISGYTQNVFSINSLFADHGYAVNNNYGFTSTPVKVQQNEDGSFFVAGNLDYFYFEPPLQIDYHSIVKFNQCGLIDSSYGINGEYAFQYNKLLAQYSHANSYIFLDNQEIAACGYITKYHSDINEVKKRPFITIISNQGNVSETFQTNNFIDLFDNDTTTIDIEIMSIELLGTDKILATAFIRNQMLSYVGFSVYNMDGTVDEGFENNGISLIEIDSSFTTITSVEKIGSNYFFIGNDENYNLYIAKTDNYSSLESAFGLNGTLISEITTFFRFFSVVSQNKIIIATRASSQLQLFKFNVNGSLDASFGTPQYPLNPSSQERILTIDTLGPDKIIIGTMVLTVPWVPVFATTTVVNANGELDTLNFQDGRIEGLYNNRPVTYGKSIQIDSANYILFGMHKSGSGYLISKITNQHFNTQISLEDDSLAIYVNQNEYDVNWYLNGELIESNQNKVGINSLGEYIVSISEINGCKVFLDTMTITTVGEKNKVADNNIFIYPNPSTGIFKATNRHKIVDAQIFSLRGDLVWEGTIPYGSSSIDLNSLSPGIYILMVSNGYKDKIVIY